MITKRLIPCLDVDKGRVVKGKKFVDIKDAGDAIELAKKYEKDGADELVFLDITASSDGRDIFLDLVKSVAQQIFIPFTVGGGIRSIQNIRQLLLAGADKVALNTAALETPVLIREGAAACGSQCMVVAIDVKKTGSGWSVFSHGGRKATGRDAVEWALEVERLGAGEILLTSIDRDGTKSGYDLELIQLLTRKLTIPVIASGGVGSWEDIRDAFLIGQADAALMASIVHSGEYTMTQLKKLLSEANISIRRKG